MANIIAVIWDCDKTLVDGYMQDPIFKDYNIEASDFWRKVNAARSALAIELRRRESATNTARSSSCLTLLSL